jgi:hypothetical protein
MSPTEWGAAIGSGLALLAGIVFTVIKLIPALRGPTCPFNADSARDQALALKELRDMTVSVQSNLTNVLHMIVTTENSVSALHRRVDHIFGSVRSQDNAVSDSTPKT